MTIIIDNHSEKHVNYLAQKLGYMVRTPCQKLLLLGAEVTGHPKCNHY